MANNQNRPISPHLQVYKLPSTGIISITHRITGTLLSLGLILFVCLVLAIAGGEESYSSMQNLMNFKLLRLFYWSLIYALFFHLCHGIRHLFWDAGLSFNRETMHQFAIIELGASFLLTLLVFVFL